MDAESLKVKRNLVRFFASSFQKRNYKKWKGASKFRFFKTSLRVLTFGKESFFLKLSDSLSQRKMLNVRLVTTIFPSPLKNINKSKTVYFSALFFHLFWICCRQLCYAIFENSLKGPEFC